MSLTKLTKPLAPYHVWVESELSANCIIGVEESLGRPSNQVTITTTGSEATIRFNVSNKIFRGQSVANPWIQDADFWTQPSEITEVEIATDDIIIKADSTETWGDEFPVRDIKVITKSTGLRIIVT
jgi:hypothetical protein